MHAADGPGPATAAPGARAALGLLLAINLFNYIDRQVLSAVLPRLQRDADIIRLDDPNAQLKLGLLTSAFMASYMVLSLVSGWLDGHGYRRWVILGVGVSLWSIASGCSGFAVGYWMLLATRCLVGVGEAAYGPIASAMLADLYPVSQRGKVIAVFNMAIPVGSALGFVIGGAVAGLTGHWRPAFWVTFSGLGLGLLCFFMREPPRPKAGPRSGGGNYWANVGELLRTRSYVLCCVGMTANVFVTGGVAAWVPVYIYERQARFAVTDPALDSLAASPDGTDRPPVPAEVLDKLRPLAGADPRTLPDMKKALADVLTPEEAGKYADTVFDAATTADSPSLTGLNVTFGGILVVAGFGATAVGAWLGEKFRPRVAGAYFWVIGLGGLLALPCYLGMLYAPFPTAWVFAFLTIFGLFLYTGPANTILANVTRSSVRATGFAVNILVIHALGDAISPTVIGAVADATDLPTAFLLLSGFFVVSGGVWVYAARFLDADTARAEAGVTPPG